MSAPRKRWVEAPGGVAAALNRYDDLQEAGMSAAGERVQGWASSASNEAARLRARNALLEAVAEAAWTYFYSMTKENYAALGAALRDLNEDEG